MAAKRAVEIFVLTFGLVVAAILSVSGIAKALDLPGAATSLRSVGVFPQVTYLLALASATIELLLAVGLVVWPSRVTHAATAILFVGFAVVATRADRLHPTQSCGCLGGHIQLRPGRFLRFANAGLALTAGALALGGEPGNALVDLGNTELAAITSFAALLGGTYWLGAFGLSVLERVRSSAGSG